MQLASFAMLLSLGAMVSASDNQSYADYYYLDSGSGNFDAYEAKTYTADDSSYGYLHLLLGVAVTCWLLGCACGCYSKQAEPRTVYMGYYHRKPCMLQSVFHKKPNAALHFWDDCYGLQGKPVYELEICKLCAKKER